MVPPTIYYTRMNLFEEVVSGHETSRMTQLLIVGGFVVETSDHVSWAAGLFAMILVRAPRPLDTTLNSSFLTSVTPKTPNAAQKV